MIELRKAKERLRWVRYNQLRQSDQEEEIQLKVRIRELCRKEELFCNQRSRIKWLTKGYRNFTFFHQIEASRRSQNRITCIQGSGGWWITNEHDIVKEIWDHYGTTFTSNRPKPDNVILEYVPNQVNEVMNSDLSRDVMEEEV